MRDHHKICRTTFLMQSLTDLRLRPLALVLAALPFVAMSPGASAQTAPRPNSGQLLQQVPSPAPPPSLNRPPLRIDQAQPAPATDVTPFAVRRIELEGNTAFDTATLHALVADGEHGQRTLAQLDALAQRLTDWYRAHGYPLARAVLPAQTIVDGTVRIRILEARYDTIRLDNRSRVDDEVLRATLAPLAPGALITQAALDRSLLLLDELPGVRAQATLAPGAMVGTSRLSVQAEPAPMLAGHVSADSAGNRYTGRVRLGAHLDINSPLHRGDRLSLSVLSSGHGLDHGRLAYQVVLNGQGTQLGAAWSALRYRLGGPLEALDAHGTAHVGSVWLSHPFVRRADMRVDGRLQYDRKRLRDALDTANLHTDRHTGSWTAGLAGERRDGWAGGGLIFAELSLTHGRLGFDDANAQSADAATARTQGRYTRWNADLSRLQNVNRRARLYLSLRGQGSGDNLDSSEQFVLGGPGSVRGYDVGVLAGASGWLATLELRHELALPISGLSEARLFLDHGALSINARPWTNAPNRARLSSAGVGVNWIGPDQWSMRLQVAAPVGSEPEQIDKPASARAWLQVARGF